MPCTRHHGPARSCPTVTLNNRLRLSRCRPCILSKHRHVDYLRDHAQQNNHLRLSRCRPCNFPKRRRRNAHLAHSPALPSQSIIRHIENRPWKTIRGNMTPSVEHHLRAIIPRRKSSPAITVVQSLHRPCQRLGFGVNMDKPSSPRRRFCYQLSGLLSR